MKPSVQEIETAVSQLTPEQLADFRAWFTEFEARSARPTSVADERAEWFHFAGRAFNSAYGDDEPDYTEADLKEINPEYRGG
jgi:hypothetical protein